MIFYKKIRKGSVESFNTLYHTLLANKFTINNFAWDFEDDNIKVYLRDHSIIIKNSKKEYLKISTGFWFMEIKFICKVKGFKNPLSLLKNNYMVDKVCSLIYCKVKDIREYVKDDPSFISSSVRKLDRKLQKKQDVLGRILFPLENLDLNKKKVN